MDVKIREMKMITISKMWTGTVPEYREAWSRAIMLPGGWAIGMSWPMSYERKTSRHHYVWWHRYKGGRRYPTWWQLRILWFSFGKKGKAIDED